MSVPVAHREPIDRFSQAVTALNHAVNYMGEKKQQLEERVGFSYIPLVYEIEAVSIVACSCFFFCYGLCRTASAKETHDLIVGLGRVGIGLIGMSYGCIKFFISPITITSLAYYHFKYYK